MEVLRRIFLALVIIGAVNWGLIGLFQIDFVATLFGGQGAVLSRVVYTLVGISGIFCLGMLFTPVIGDDSDDALHSGKVNYATEFGDENNFPDNDKEKRD